MAGEQQPLDWQRFMIEFSVNTWSALSSINIALDVLRTSNQALQDENRLSEIFDTAFGRAEEKIGELEKQIRQLIDDMGGGNR